MGISFRSALPSLANRLQILSKPSDLAERQPLLNRIVWADWPVLERLQHAIDDLSLSLVQNLRGEL